METSTPEFEHISAKIKINNLPDDIDLINDLASNIISGLNLMEIKRIEHKFNPVGYTLVCILSQSHLAIHTWPEYKILHIDLVSCAGTKIEDFDKVLNSALANFDVVDFDSKLHLI